MQLVEEPDSNFFWGTFSSPKSFHVRGSVCEAAVGPMGFKLWWGHTDVAQGEAVAQLVSAVPMRSTVAGSNLGSRRSELGLYSNFFSFDLSPL
jgi:hypothetical protein